MTRGLTPPDPRSLCPLSSEFVEPPPKNAWRNPPSSLTPRKNPGYATVTHEPTRKCDTRSNVYMVHRKQSLVVYDRNEFAVHLVFCFNRSSTNRHRRARRSFKMLTFVLL
jgi:hypothetical protein